MIVFWAQDLAKGAGARLEAAKEAGEAAAEVSPEVAQRMASLPAKLKELQGQVRNYSAFALAKLSLTLEPNAAQCRLRHCLNTRLK